MLRLSLCLIMVFFTNNAYSCVMEYKQNINTDGILDDICLLEPKNKNDNYSLRVCLSNNRCYTNSTILEEADLPTPSRLDYLIGSIDDNGFFIQTDDFQVTVMYQKNNLLVTKVIGSSRERPTIFIDKESATFRATKEVVVGEGFEKFDFEKYKVGLIPDENDAKGIIKFKKKNLKSYSTNDLLNLIYMGGIHDETIDNVDVILEYLQARSDVDINSVRDLTSQSKSLYPNRKTKSKIQNKAFLYKYSQLNQKTKMYLIKGDKVSLLNEKTDDAGQKWYFINYKGKKDLNMWIKAEAVDLTPKATEPKPTEETAPQEPTPQTKVTTPEPIKIAKQELETTPPKNTEVIKAEKAEPIKSASGSISLVLLASTLGLLGWKYRNIV